MNEPKAPPKKLSAEAKRLWREIVSEYRIDDASGLLILQTALEAFDRMRQAQAIIKKEGASFRDRFEQIKSHPMLIVERDSRSQMLQALKGLNLDIEPLSNPRR